MTSSTDVVAALSVEPARARVAAADPCTIVIFGASGDLAKRKLIPALFELASQKSLARRFAIIGFARTPMTDEAFRDQAEDAVRKHGESGKPDEEELQKFVKSFAYVAGEYHHPEAFQRLAKRIEELDRERKLVLMGTASTIWRRRQTSIRWSSARSNSSRRRIWSGRPTENPGCAS